MKKYIFAALLFITLFAHAVTIDFKPQVSTSGSRTVGLDMNGSYSKYRSVSKTFMATIRSTTPVRVVCILGAVSGNKGVSTRVIVEDIDLHNPLECAISSSSKAEETRLRAWCWEGFGRYGHAHGIDYYSRSGNAKVEGCCIVYEVESGKFVGMKYTSKGFADAFHMEYKQDIKQIIKEEREKLKSGK